MILPQIIKHVQPVLGRPFHTNKKRDVPQKHELDPKHLKIAICLVRNTGTQDTMNLNSIISESVLKKYILKHRNENGQNCNT